MGEIKPLDYLRAVRDDRELSGNEKLVALMVMSYAGPDGHDAHPGEKLLAAETGMTEKTVRNHLRSLRGKGWVVMTFSGRGGNRKLASIFHLAIPTGNQDRLNDAQPVTSDRSTGNQQLVQPVTSDRSTGNGYRTYAFELPLVNASGHAAAAAPPARQAEQEKTKELKGSRRVVRRRQPPAKCRADYYLVDE